LRKNSQEFPHKFYKSHIPGNLTILQWEFLVALIMAYTQNKYKQRTDLLSTDWLRAAQLGQLRRGVLKFSEPPTIQSSAIIIVRRRGLPKRRNSTDVIQVSKVTQLTTRRRVELS